MELKKVLSGIDNLKAKGKLDIDILNVEKDSRAIKKGDLFIAIKGYDVDGHEYIEAAVENGAVAVIVDSTCDISKIKINKEITLIIAENTRKALAICACNINGQPSKKFKLIGITGTKGKTTTAFMMKSILEKAGQKVGLIGTVATYIGDEKLADADRTTPESNELQKLFAKMAKAEVDAVVMEVSSQSLKLDRVTGSHFDTVVFTNFSRDHISPKEHTDIDDYFNSKTKLFEMCKNVVLNADDYTVIKVKKMFDDLDITTYGIDNNCDILAKDVTVQNSGVDYKIRFDKKNELFKVAIPGRFSVYNSLAALVVCKKLGAGIEDIKEALLDIRVPGRSELVPNSKGLTIMIDYAHSPESLESILKAVKSYARGKVISVFGCGGNRDNSKRPVMGEISTRIADYTIVTSDNPRNEDPNTIIEEIKAGITASDKKYECIVDRVEAIKKAIKLASKQDVIILAGKGHEPYQEIKGVKHSFDERIIVKEILEKK